MKRSVGFCFGACKEKQFDLQMLPFIFWFDKIFIRNLFVLAYAHLLKIKILLHIFCRFLIFIFNTLIFSACLLCNFHMIFCFHFRNSILWPILIDLKSQFECESRKIRINGDFHWFRCSSICFCNKSILFKRRNVIGKITI